MIFWIIIGLLTFLIALLCFYPLLKKNITNSKGIERAELNKVFYLNRLQELEEDEAQGLIENNHQLKIELQQTLLQDIPEEKTTIEEQSSLIGKIWFLSGFLALFILSTLIYVKVGAWQEEIMLEKTAQKLPHFYERLKNEDTNPLNEKELQQLTIALRLKLQKEPNSAGDWWLLGQLAMIQENGQLAYDSYTKAYTLAPNNIEYKLAYAQTLMLSRDNTDKLKGMTLLREVLRVDHTNMQALSLLAFQYFEKEDYKMAIATWSMMLKLLPEADPRQEILKKSINKATELIKNN